MKPNCFWFFRLAVWLVIALTIVLLFIYPLVTGLLINAGRMPMSATKYLGYVEFAQVILMRFLGLVWIFFLGSCFASFLNVVAWRIPRGRGINGSSKCPYCNVKLRFSDNIPIAGWLRNNGRCRSCRLPISPRYLIVELMLGFIFLVVGVTELVAGGINLPLRPVERLRGFEYLIFDPKWDLIQLTVYHLVLVCLLFTFALIRSEKLKIPVLIFLTGTLFGIGLPLIWPSMLLVAWPIGVDQLVAMNRFSPAQLITLVAGLSGGLACGGLIDWSSPRSSHGQARNPADHPTVPQSSFVFEGVAGLSLVGLFLGWQSAISVTLLYFFVTFLIQALGISSPGPDQNRSTRVLFATLLHLLGWRFLTWLVVWPGPTTHWTFMVFAVLALMGMAMVTRSQTLAAEAFALDALAFPMNVNEVEDEEIAVNEVSDERT